MSRGLGRLREGGFENLQLFGFDCGAGPSAFRADGAVAVRTLVLRLRVSRLRVAVQRTLQQPPTPKSAPATKINPQNKKTTNAGKKLIF